ncbi:MAG TPA: hypothetical protein PKE06_10050 [Flavilitoribacter sp.]|nr:hypothetical protein [Flavilitoribacter sp.]HMQ89543.1 hypothetical protein [Flavilitoribacter sp.]
MLRYFTITLLFYLFTAIPTVIAQQENGGGIIRSLLKPMPGQVATAGQIKGSPLLYEDWQWADLYLTSEEAPLQVWVNFDLVNETLLVRINDEVQGALPGKNWFEARVNGMDTDVFRSQLEDFPDGIYSIIYRGKVTLWKKLRKTLDGEPLRQAFQMVTVYLLQPVQGKCQPVELSSASIAKVLPQYNQAIDEWQRKHGNKRWTETTIIELLRDLTSI